MVAATVAAVEGVDMVNPDVGVVCVEGDAVVHTLHDGEIAHLETLDVSHEKAKAVDRSVVANALDGDVKFRIGLPALHLDPLGRRAKGVDVGGADFTNDAQRERRGDVAFLISREDGLQASERAAGEASTDGAGRSGCDIDHFSPRFKPAVVGIGAHPLWAVLMGKAFAIVWGHVEHISLCGGQRDLRVSRVNRHDTQAIVACWQPDGIDASKGCIVAHQLVVKSRVGSLGIGRAYVGMICLSPRIRQELGKG